MALSDYSLLHARFRIWTNRLNLCLNLRPQWGHAWRGSCPHSILMCRRNEWYSWYTLQHLGHTNKLLFCCVVVSVLCALWFWLDKMEAKAPISVPCLYFPSSSTETVKKYVSTILASVTWHFQDVKSIKIVFISVEVIWLVTLCSSEYGQRFGWIYSTYFCWSHACRILLLWRCTCSLKCLASSNYRVSQSRGLHS
jgi:hypothetical protein